MMGWMITATPRPVDDGLPRPQFYIVAANSGEEAMKILRTFGDLGDFGLDVVGQATDALVEWLQLEAGDIRQVKDPRV